jgi:hypothetical protein
VSLLDGKHKVYVQLRKRGRDNRGERVQMDDGDRIPVKVIDESVREWASAEEDMTNGFQVVDLLVIRTKHWPGDVNSHVFYNGQMYETSGTPQPLRMSRRTRHWRVTLKWIGKDPLA